MFWAFAQGASGSLLKDMEAAKASQQEMEMWKQRMEIQQQLVEQAEAVKAKNRIVNSFEDMKSGKLVETTASGETREVALPANYVEGRKQQAALMAEQERLKAERDAQKFELDRIKAESSAEANRAQAENARSSASARAQRLPSQIEADKARAEAARRTPSTVEKEAKRDAERAETKAEKEVTAAYNTVARSENAAIAEAARRIRFSPLSPSEKLEALTELMNATE